MAQNTSQVMANGRFSIPNESAAPKPEPIPSYRQPINNFADKTETVKKALEWAKNSYNYVKSQPKRTRNDELRKMADEMWRVAKTRTELSSEESENTEDTRANFPSVTYFETVKTINAGEKAVILGNTEDLPMEYQPLPGVGGDLEKVSRRIADDQNAVLAWALEKRDDAGRDMYQAIGSALLGVNKYGNQILEMDWDYRVDERWVNEPKYAKIETANEDTGETEVVEDMTKVVGRKFAYKKVTIANNPRLLLHDMADCMFDCNIDDPQDQNIFDIRKDMQLAEIWQLQRSGLLMNVGKIRSIYFNGDIEDEQAAREDHRGGSGSVGNETNLIELHKCRIRLPIDDETGEWNEDTQIPHWYETWWAGSLASGNAVCLGIIPNAHFCKKIPVLIFHSFEDDNGAFHLGNPELLKAGYSMLTTIINQYFDNVSSRNQAPYVVERGSIGKRFLTVDAGGNRIIFKEPGFNNPTQMDIKDTTAQTFTAIEKAEDLVRRAAGINKPLLGEGLGSRASASEAINTLNQALKPALEDAKYKADQLLPWIGEWIMEMTRQFSDPKQQIAVMYRGAERVVSPALLYGEQTVRVVAIKKLQDSILRVQQEQNIMTQYIPAFGSLMSQEGMVSLAKQIAKNADFEEVDTWFKLGDDFDARHVARSENENILVYAVTDFPKANENHPAHIDEHKLGLSSYLIAFPQEEHNKEGITKMKAHIAMHERLQSERPQIQPQGSTEEPIDEGAPRTVGEMDGDIVAGALGGAQAPDTGRPPETLSA